MAVKTFFARPPGPSYGYPRGGPRAAEKNCCPIVMFWNRILELRGRDFYAIQGIEVKENKKEHVIP